MDDRQELIEQLRTLYRAHNEKVAARLCDLPPECGMITREACKIAALVPRMIHYAITDEELGLTPQRAIRF